MTDAELRFMRAHAAEQQVQALAERVAELEAEREESSESPLLSSTTQRGPTS
jgi:hypothetical protein